MDERDLSCYDIGSLLEVLELCTEDAGEPLFGSQKSRTWGSVALCVIPQGELCPRVEQRSNKGILKDHLQTLGMLVV